jgi:predicted nucleic acid-binding protein
MNQILVDSSIWIDYFKRIESPVSSELDTLIDNGNIYTNDLILSEIIPYLKLKNQKELIDILLSLERLPMNINWNEIIEFQTLNLRTGINKVGIPDLLIVQNVIQNEAVLFTIDRHFELMKKNIKLRLHLKSHLV